LDASWSPPDTSGQRTTWPTDRRDRQTPFGPQRGP